MDWTESPRKNPPPEGVLVEVCGADYAGTWVGVAQRKDYKPGSSRAQLRRKWRWCLADGTPFPDQDGIEAWRIRQSEERG